MDYNLKGLIRKFKRLVPSRAILIPMLFFILINTITVFAATPITKKNRVTNQEYYYENRLLTEENNKLLAQIKKDNDEFYSDVIHKLLPKERIIELAKLRWKYSISVNNQEITKDKVAIDAKSSTITVVLVEDVIDDKLPLDVARLGSIEAEGNVKLEDSVKFTATKAKHTVVEKRDGAKLTVIYTFNEVEVGEIITLKMTTSMKNQLKLDNEIIEIFNSQV